MRLCCVLLILSASSSALADDRSAVMAYAAFGFGGELKLDVSAEGPGADLLDRESEVDLDPTLGFGLRFEQGLGRLFALGALVEFLWFETDAAMAEKIFVVNIDIWAKGRIVVQMSPGFSLELYAGVPVGFTVSEEAEENFDRGLGWNVGVMTGVQAILHGGLIGIFGELGWRRHQVFYNSSTDLGVLGDLDIRANFYANQLGLHFGTAFRF